MGERLDEETRQTLLRMTRSVGVEAMAAEVGVSPGTLTRALAGFGVRRGSIMQLTTVAQRQQEVA